MEEETALVHWGGSPTLRCCDGISNPRGHYCSNHHIKGDFRWIPLLLTRSWFTIRASLLW